jgi:CheY-like chemotaxis protein
MNGNKAMDLIKLNCSQNDFKHTDYRLIITDLQMKPIDGYQLSTMIRNYLIELKIAQPLIVLSTADNA